MKKTLFPLLIFINTTINIAAFEITNDKGNNDTLAILKNYKGDKFYSYNEIKKGKTLKIEYSKNRKNINEIRIYKKEIIDKIKNKKKLTELILDRNYKKLFLITISSSEISKNGKYLLINEGQSFVEERKTKNPKNRAP